MNAHVQFRSRKLFAARWRLAVTPVLLAAFAVLLVTAPTKAAEPDNDQLVMDFQDARLETVLEYLSEQAGLVILNDVDLDQRVTVFNRQPIGVDEAVNMLNAVLFEHGYTGIRRGSLLKVVPLGEARTESIAVHYGADPERIGQSDTLITQVVPISYADATGIAENLAPLVNSAYGQIVANTSSNALILTDTEANVRRVVQIISALDQSISQVTEVRVFALEYADATDTAQLLEEVFENEPTDAERLGRAIRSRFTRGRPGFPGGPDDNAGEGGGPQARRVIASADERTNSVVVSASPDLMVAVAAVIADLDADTTAKESVLIYHVKNMEASDLAELFNDLFTEDGATATGGGGRVRVGGAARIAQARGGQAATAGEATADLVGQVTAVANEGTNSLLVLTQEKNFDRIRQILTELDRSIPQVLIRVLVSEVTYDDSLDLGVEIDAINVADEENDRLFTDFNLFESTLGLNYLLLDSDNFRLAIRALEATGKFDVLSRPYLLTSDNHEANITVGEQVPFVTNTRVTEDGGIINTIEYRDIGIILNVTPQINDEGLVVLNLRQELSALTERAVPISETLDAVVLNQRSVETQVGVANGQTVVIGGLMEDELQEIRTQVPLLGDIPIIGNLFRRTQRNKAKTELLLFLTPEVIGDPSDLRRTSERVRSEAQTLQDAVEPGLLQRHLDRMKLDDVAGRDPEGREPMGTPAAPVNPPAPDTMP